MAPEIQPTSSDGRRRLSDSHRASISAAQRRRWESLTPEQQAAERDKLNRVRPTRAAAPPTSSAPPPAPPPAPSSGGPVNPLVDALGAGTGGGSSSPGRSNGLGGPPRFVIPDLPPLEAPDGAPELDGMLQPSPDELAAFHVDPAQVADLISFPFDMLADRRGDHWKLRPAERDRVAGAMARKINEHATVARALDMGGDWILIVGGLAVIVSSRLAEDARNARPDADPGSRPGLAGITLPGAGGGAPPEPPRAGPRLVRMDGESAGRLGTLNGYGAAYDGGAPAVVAEIEGRPTQSFG